MRMILAVIAAFLLAAPVGAAEPKWLTYVMPGFGALSISDQPCTVPNAIEEWKRIRALVRAQSHVDIGEPKQSRLLWQDRVFAGCYTVGPDNSRVYNIDSTGDKLYPPIPLDKFVPHEGALPEGGTSV